MKMPDNKVGIVFAIALLLIGNLNSALTLAPESPTITSCICETNLVKLVASNTGNALESVIMSSSGDKAWAIPGPREFNLAAKSSKDITAFVTPDCFAVPGKYSVSVTGKSAQGSATAKIGIDVSACVVLADDAAISLCRGEIGKGKISIKNIARDEERTYRITASSKGIAASAITTPSKVAVGVNSQKEFEYSIDAANINVGEYSLDVKAQALYEATDAPTTDVDTASVKVIVKNCENYELAAPKSADVCAGVPTVFKAKLVNNGAPADIKLSTDTPYAIIKPSSGTLHLGESADLEITVNAPKGEYKARLFAKSPLKAVESEMAITSKECTGVELSMQVEKSICSESGAIYDLMLRNRDTPTEYTLTVSGIDAKLAMDKVSLGKAQSQTVKLEIPKDGKTGTFSATISASSKDGKDTITKEISVQKCYDFRLTGPEVALCPCEQATIDYELINFGIKDDTFALNSESPFLTLTQSSARVASKEKSGLKVTVDSCSLESGKYNGIIVAKSSAFPGLTDKLKLDLTVKSKEQCFGIELKPASTDIFSKCEIKSQSVMVKNIGIKETAVSLSATLGSKVTPDNLLLAPSESREVTLVIFPSPSKCGTEFKVDMKGESKGVSATKQFKVYMEPEEAKTPVSTATIKPIPTTGGTGNELKAEINYTNNTLIINSLPDVKIVISEEGKNSTENLTDSGGNFAQEIGAGTFLITLSRPGYAPLTLAVNVTDDGSGAEGFAGNLGTIPLLLVAFLIIVAALYFVLRRGGSDEDGESVEEDEEEKKPKRKSRRRK
ncbi:MAG: hypothetical protein AABX01_05440 [Candidatus Micrarchaeota archaeon]